MTPEEEEQLRQFRLGQATSVNPDDALMGGLGLTGAAFASQTGRAPTPTPQGPLSPLAQKVAANDLSRLAQQGRPNLIGTPQTTTTTPRLVGPNAAPQYTGTPSARPVPGTQLVPSGQTPSVRPTGGPPSVRPTGGPRFPYTVNRSPSLLRGLLGRAVAPVGAFTTGYGIGSVLDNTFGISDRIADAIVGGSDQPAFTPGELSTSATATGQDPLLAQAEASTPPVYDAPSELQSLFAQNNRGELTPEQYTSELNRILDKQKQEIKTREANVAEGQVELAKQIRELSEVTPEQQEAQEFLDTRAQSLGEPRTDVITPFQEQAQLTADLFTDPNTAIGGFVPRATFTLPDGTIVQENEAGQRREISAEQLRQFEQDMASLGQPSNQQAPMSVAETRSMLQERFGAPTISAIQALPAGQGLGQPTDAQGRMITRAAAQPETAAPAAALSDFEQASLERQQRIGGTGSFEGDSAAREERLAERDRRPGETRTERDTRIARSRTEGARAGALTMADAVDLAGGDRTLARTMVVRSRRGLDPMTGKEQFVPREVTIEGNRYIQLTPEYFQPVAQDTPEETRLEQTLKNLEADLASGRLTQGEYDIAVQNAKDVYIGLDKKAPSKTQEGEVEGVIQQTIAEGESQPDSIPTINSQEEYDKLPKGSRYIDSEGKSAIKR